MNWWQRWRFARAVSRLRREQAILDMARGVGMGRTGFAFNERVKSLEDRVETHLADALRLLGMKP